MLNPGAQLTNRGADSLGFIYSLAVVVYFVLVVIALLVNSTMLIVLWRLRKRLFEPPGTFYTVVVGLMAFTSLNSLVQTVFIAPQYVQQATEQATFNPTFLRVFFVLDMLSNYGILGFSTVVAANRYSTFVMGATCPVFRRGRLRYLLLLVCFAIVFFAAAPTALGCTMLHAATDSGYVDVCPDERLAEGVKLFLGASYYIVCAVSAQFYVRTYWLIKNQRGHLIEHEGHRTAPETVILKQALVIFGLYIISLVLSTILPLFCSSHSFLLSFSLNGVSLLLSSVYPGLFLVSAREMRREVISWVPCGRSTCWSRGKQRVSSAETLTDKHRKQSNMAKSMDNSRGNANMEKC